MTSDLSRPPWECCAVAAARLDAEGLDAHAVTWLPRRARHGAGALRAAGSLDWATRDYDRDDWWFRATFTVPSRRALRAQPGWVATLADVWVNACTAGT